MRIGVDIRALSEPKAGGVFSYTKNLVENLKKIDHSNEYIFFENSFKKTGIPNKLLNFSFRFFNWPKIDKRLNGCDVFIAPNLSFLSLSKETKKIVVVHDLSFELFPEFYSWKMRLWHKIINPKKFICEADKIVAVSENTKRDLIKLYSIPESKIKVIYPGVDNVDMINEKKDDYILTLSTLEPRKNIETLILAFKKIFPIGHKLVIAGNKGWKNKRIFELAKGHPNIIIKNYVTEKEKSELYRKARCFVYLSFYEGFGFPPLEALSYGLPVIASLNSSLPEVLGSEAIYVDPFNVNEVAKALEEVILNGVNPNKGEQIRKFSWEKAAKEFLDYIS